MDGRACRCDNCGEIAFVVRSFDVAEGALFVRHTVTMPDGWFVVGWETFDNGEIFSNTRHYCGAACLAFAANYLHSNGEITTTKERKDQ